MGSALSGLAMVTYSLLLAAVLVVGSPYWLFRMLTSGRYRAGLSQRLGRVPPELRAAIAGRQVVWLHAVSVGEVLAATRLVAELESALGEAWIIVVSTTTATGQTLARQRFGAGRVFYYPLDFAWSVRAWLRALQPRLLVLMESELWPRMVVECNCASIPVAVVNARVSDRSFTRGLRLRALWGPMLRRIDALLAQSEEDARRLLAMGARAAFVRAVGNLKYDVRAPQGNATRTRIQSLLSNAPLVIAGSTLEGEEAALLTAWPAILKASPSAVLLLAPRHPQRFAAALELARESGHPFLPCSQLSQDTPSLSGGTILVLDTLGDLAAIYSLGAVAFVGGSLVPRGGHNPLEPAQFRVPVVMGPSSQNFRDIVASLQIADAIRIIQDKQELQAVLIELLTARPQAEAMGERGHQVFERQQGATARTVEALLPLVQR